MVSYTPVTKGMWEHTDPKGVRNMRGLAQPCQGMKEYSFLQLCSRASLPPVQGLNDSLQGLQGKAWGSQPKAERCKEFNSGFLVKGREGNKNKVEFLHLLNKSLHVLPDSRTKGL